MASAPRGWTEEQARAVVQLGFTFPFGSQARSGFGNAVAARGNHRVYPRLDLTVGGSTMFEPYTAGSSRDDRWGDEWAPGMTFSTPEAAVVWADIEGWGSGTNS